jgi:hypothetical protein
MRNFFGSKWVSIKFYDLSLYLYLIKPNKILRNEHLILVFN